MNQLRRWKGTNSEDRLVVLIVRQQFGPHCRTLVWRTMVIGLKDPSIRRRWGGARRSAQSRPFRGSRRMSGVPPPWKRVGKESSSFAGKIFSPLHYAYISDVCCAKRWVKERTSRDGAASCSFRLNRKARLLLHLLVACLFSSDAMRAALASHQICWLFGNRPDGGGVNDGESHLPVSVSVLLVGVEPTYIQFTRVNQKKYF